MIKFFADYLGQLKDQTPTPTPEPKPETPTSSKGDQVAPVVETPEFNRWCKTVANQLSMKFQSIQNQSVQQEMKWL